MQEEEYGNSDWSLLEGGLFGISILMGPYDRRPWMGSALTASLLLIELQFCGENQKTRHERLQSGVITANKINPLLYNTQFCLKLDQC